MNTFSILRVPMRTAEWLSRDSAWRAGWVEGARAAIATCSLLDVRVGFIDGPLLELAAVDVTTAPAVRERGAPT